MWGWTKKIYSYGSITVRAQVIYKATFLKVELDKLEDK